MSWLRELAKRAKERAILWLAGLILLVLSDEYIKEGYWFNPGDVINSNITHEKIILVLTAALIYMVISRVQRSP